MYWLKVSVPSVRICHTAKQCQVLLVSCKTGAPVSPLVGLFTGILITPWALPCSYCPCMSLITHNQKEMDSKYTTELPASRLEKSSPYQKHFTNKQQACVLMVKTSLQFPQYFLSASITSRWWDLTLSLTTLIQLSERWIRARSFAKKQLKPKHFTSLFIFTLLLKKSLGQLHQILTSACHG